MGLLSETLEALCRFVGAGGDRYHEADSKGERNDEGWQAQEDQGEDGFCVLATSDFGSKEFYQLGQLQPSPRSSQVTSLTRFGITGQPLETTDKQHSDRRGLPMRPVRCKRAPDGGPVEGHVPEVQHEGGH